MAGPATPLSVLAAQCEDERARIRKNFEHGTGAKATLLALCELADRSLQQVFKDVLRLHDSSKEGLSLLALGGYGRRMLFPFSDLDILFLFANDKTEV
jgi:[protein-PII] uridylyltransferase